MKLYDRPVMHYKPNEREKGMKVSIVIAILNSHEIVRRQLLYFTKMPLPEGVEVVFVDDGSNPPLVDLPIVKEIPFVTMHRIDNPGKWTQPAARNYGAKQAKGEFCILTDIDHIIPLELIEIAMDPPADVVRFKREVAVLDENGNFTQDWDTLREWKFDHNQLRIAPHGNSYLIRTGVYLGCGGVDERYVGTGRYPNREEILLKRNLRALEAAGKITVLEDHTKPMIYMFPNGHYCNNRDKDFNPFGFFHNTSRLSNKEKRRRNG